MKKFIVLICAVLLLSSFTAQAATATPTFSDVPTTHWAYGSIENAVTKGLVAGIGGGKYDPEGALTHAQVAQIIYNGYNDSLSATSSVKIKDVTADDWYYKATTWLVQTGLADLTDSYFYPNDPAPRRFVTDSLYRLSKAAEVTLPTTNPAIVFPDVTERSESITALQRAGVINGFPDGTFGPDQLLTRAQMAKIIDLFTDLPGLTPVTTSPPISTNFPQLSGPNVWWETSIYQEILDYAATKEGVVTHVDVLPDYVDIWVGAKWPAMQHYRHRFSNNGYSRTYYSYNIPGDVFLDRGTIECNPTGPDANNEAVLHTVNWIAGYYSDYKGRTNIPEHVKFPWE